MEGELNTTTDWYGYIANVSLKKGGGIRFRFSYPASMYPLLRLYVILYSLENVMKIRPQQSCWQKFGLIVADQVNDQILELDKRASWNGCVLRNSTLSTQTVVCQGERRYNKPRQIYIAISNCRAKKGLFIKYRLEFFGYHNRPCSRAESTLRASAVTLLASIVLFWAVIGWFSDHVIVTQTFTQARTKSAGITTTASS